MHPLYCVNLLANKISATKDFPPDVGAQYTIFCPCVKTPGVFNTSDCQSYNLFIPFLSKYYIKESAKCNECKGIGSVSAAVASCFFFCSFLRSVGESIGGNDAKKLFLLSLFEAVACVCC